MSRSRNQEFAFDCGQNIKITNVCRNGRQKRGRKLEIEYKLWFTYETYIHNEASKKAIEN